MKVFVSSLITAMEPLRAAAREAITTFRHEAIMAEDFGAQPNTPQIACLSGLREADVVVLILGERYGAAQASGLSATHEEYRDAKGRKPVLVFVQEGIEREAQEEAFLEEVQGFEKGSFRSAFRTDGDLRQAITRALYDFALANATGPVDQDEMAERAVALLPKERRNSFSGSTTINIAVAGGPRQSILRPVEIEKRSLADELIKQALFGNRRLLELGSGIKPGMDGGTLIIMQESGAKISLNELGSICISLPLKRSNDRMMQGLIYEVVLEQFRDALHYASWTLDYIDPTQRLAHVAIAANLTGADHMSWNTQLESDASPNSINMSMGNNERALVQDNRPRAALRLNSTQIVEDLVIRLRRQWR